MINLLLTLVATICLISVSVFVCVVLDVFRFIVMSFFRISKEGIYEAFIYILIALLTILGGGLSMALVEVIYNG